MGGMVAAEVALIRNREWTLMYVNESRLGWSFQS
jgi:hypothetical protein